MLPHEKIFWPIWVMEQEPAPAKSWGYYSERIRQKGAGPEGPTGRDRRPDQPASTGQQRLQDHVGIVDFVGIAGRSAFRAFENRGIGAVLPAHHPRVFLERRGILVDGALQGGDAVAPVAALDLRHHGFKRSSDDVRVDGRGFDQARNSAHG
jgi:hypothetical protein